MSVSPIGSKDKITITVAVDMALDRVPKGCRHDLGAKTRPEGPQWHKVSDDLPQPA